MGIPDADYTNTPTVEKGWQHALTMPRELKVKDNRIVQLPLDEYKNLRGEKREDLECEVENVELNFVFSRCKDFNLILRESIEISYSDNIFTLNLEKCGFGRKTRSVKLSDLESVQIFLDSSSIEIFLNSGEEVLHLDATVKI